MRYCNKKIRRLFYLWLAFLVLVVTNLNCLSQQKFTPPKSNFMHYGIKDGLSQQIIRSISQDKLGFIWIATEDGLNRFDGYEFRNYYTNRKVENSLPDNFIYAIYPSADSGLWLGTNSQGLVKYSYNTNSFHRISNNTDIGKKLSNSRVYAIIEDTDNNIWIGTFANGLFRYNLKTKEISSFKHEINNINSVPSNRVFSLAIDNSNKLWVRTDSHLAAYNSKSNSFTFFELPGKLINADYATSLLVDKNDILWTSSGNGLIKYNIKTQKLEIIPLYNYKGELIEIIELKEQNIDYLWFGTYSGLYLYNKNTGKLINYRNEPNDPNSLAQDVVIALHIDKTGSLWAGSGSSGISKLNLQSKMFMHFKHDINSPNSLSSNLIRALMVDSKNNIWVGHVSGAIDLITDKNKIVRQVKSSIGIKQEGVLGFPTSFMERSNGEIWVSTWGEGIYIFDRRGNQLNQIIDIFDFNENEELNKIIHYLKEDKFGNIWIGTETGLVLYNPKTKAYRRFIHDENVPNSITSLGVQSNCIHIDYYNNIWVGTWGGLNRFTPENPNENSFITEYKITQYKHEAGNAKSISDSRVISMWYNSDFSKNQLLVGTYGGGLNKIEFFNQKPDKLDIKVYGRNEGLSNSLVYTIECDENNSAWLGTNRGLSSINFNTNSINNYFENDGLQSDQFYWGASCQGNNGELLFGGVNGFNLFFPKNIVEDKNLPQVVFTDLKILNKSVKINEANNGQVILTTNINNTKEIKLDYNSRVITIEFAALHYAYPEDNKYKYMLEGFDPDWIETNSKKRFATYTNLEPGTYIFKVRAANYDGVWTNNPKILQIRIIPPFYQRKWFVYSIIVLLVALIIFIFLYRTNQIIRINKTLEKKVMLRTSELSNKNIQLTQQTEELNKVNSSLKEQQEKIKIQANKMEFQRDELQKANRIKDKLFSVIAHDLKNPINNAKGYVDLLQYRYNSFNDEKKKNIISALGNSVESIYNLLVTLLNWSGTKHGKILFEPHVHYINEVITESIQSIHVLAENKKLKIINNGSNCRIKVELDRNLFDTVLNNLLKNAIKYSHEEGTVTIECEQVNENIILEIHDNGIGVPKDKINDLFNADILFSTQGTLNETGIGLGLAISKKYIEKHRGKIWIKSEENKGSSIYIKIPLRQPSSSQDFK